ncbi:unnamed protein product [Dracunculus medinensis]|uniref:3Beta_HSD domain-containing protein n=1 Tax=Dracunculus medinensis TaxID=318479 RepID=A0A0N4UCP1_DRAME|nr:unnamed protein product [Dracunculus medinensis]
MVVNKEIVGITGGSGFLAQHLIAYLQNNSTATVREIRIIDRRPFKKFLDYPSSIPISIFILDICNKDELSKSFESCTTIFHCAGKQFQYIHINEDIDEQYIHDNIDTTENVITVMIDQRIRNIVYVSDAYAHLPRCDNYGHSEQVHINIPENFMLGSYGESKVRAESYVMKFARKNMISALILRPTFIYGEGESHLTSTAFNFCQKFQGFPYICGNNRGNHQYIYAGNMAAIMERCMNCLRSDAMKYNGEIIYCIDATSCIPFRDFIIPYLEARNFNPTSTMSYMKAFLITAFYELLNKIYMEKSINRLTMQAFQFLNGWTVGFSNRKLRLFLDFIPPFEQSVAMKKSVAWHKENINQAIAIERPKVG